MKKLDAIIKISGNEIKRGISIPDKFKQTFRDVLSYCDEKRGGYVRVQISPPFKHRSTGEKSSNHHINGHVQQISNETGEEFDVIKTYAKKKAVKYGYPIRTDLFGNAVPISETEIDDEQASFLIDALHEMAAFLDITLIEE